MKWKPLDTIKPFNVMPVLHWPYRYNFVEDTYNTAFVPFAVVLGLLWAVRCSLRDCWFDFVQGIDRIEKWRGK